MKRIFLIFNFAFLILDLGASAQIQQAWVARYNNGIPNGNQNTTGGTGYATLKYASNGDLLWTARYDSTNFPAAKPTALALDGQGCYVLDGLLAIQERDSNNTATVNYTRGLDLSSSLSRAGGIGGLLARSDTNGSLYYHADGNGNVTLLIDTNQYVVARYLYSPFGALIGKWGSYADLNHYRFSSKEFDSSSGLYAFGYRFYGPTIQRWLTRDPIGLAGGPNAYTFVGNNPINTIDPLGLWNLWNPGTWGVPNGVGTSLWNSFNPVDGSAGWTGFSFSGAGQGAAAFWDGIDPFGNPLADLGLYDPCDKALIWSRQIGTITGTVEAQLASGAALDYAADIAADLLYGDEDAPLILQNAADTGLSGTALARQLGQAGEDAVGITGPKVGITIPGTDTIRFPDQLTSTTLTEVKNVQNLSFTQQLQDYSAYAQQNGLQFNLYVRPTTTLSGPLQNAINSGLINKLYIPTP